MHGMKVTGQYTWVVGVTFIYVILKRFHFLYNIFGGVFDIDIDHLMLKLMLLDGSWILYITWLQVC